MVIVVTLLNQTSVLFEWYMVRLVPKGGGGKGPLILPCINYRKCKKRVLFEAFVYIVYIRVGGGGGFPPRITNRKG